MGPQIAKSYGKISGERLAKAFNFQIFIKSYQSYPVIGSYRRKIMDVNLVNYENNILISGRGFGVDTKACKERAIHNALKPVTDILAAIAQEYINRNEALSEEELLEKTWDAYLNDKFTMEIKHER